MECFNMVYAREKALEEMKVKILNTLPKVPSFTKIEIELEILTYSESNILCSIGIKFSSDYLNENDELEMAIEEVEQNGNRYHNKVYTFNLPNCSEAMNQTQYNVYRGCNNFAIALMDNYLNGKYDDLFKKCKQSVDKHLQPLVEKYYPNITKTKK